MSAVSRERIGFIWLTEPDELPKLSVGVCRERALALMREQIAHHASTSIRRGAIAARLHRLAV